MLGKVCEGRKTYTSMCDIVDDFWKGMNDDEIGMGRSSLPKLSVEPGVGDDKPVAKKASGKKDKEKASSFQMRSTSIYSTEVDDETFSEAGFTVGVQISMTKKRG